MRIIVTADGSRTVSSPTYGETYGSTHGALSEALHVYLQGSGVAHRLATHQPTRVLEIGFGTGLNFLVTAEAAVRAGTALHYTSFEREPLPTDIIAAVHHGPESSAELVAALVEGLAASSTPTDGPRRRLLFGGSGAVVLDLVLADAREAEQLGYLGRGEAAYHAIYLDAFSPKTNPELWTDDYLRALAAAIAPGGSLATFTVSGTVRRALASAGLTVSKRQGPPGGKREMLVATRPATEP